MNKISYLKSGTLNYGEFIQKTIDFTLEKQLLDRKLWAKFVDVFRTKEDISDIGWRCEFWGKMMRGACLIYTYQPNSELYSVLEETVKDLLTVQDEEGRFTSYIDEFKGWDMWGRKYVITSLLHFCKICKDESLKVTIVEAVKRHADYIVGKLGNKEGQINILTTSNFWGGLNSASICETFVDLYNIAKDTKYLDFAKYIISTGGCLDGNIVELAYEGKKAPHEYPVTKAYEMMSFFEGCLEYYKTTGEEYYFTVFKNFINKVKEQEITIIGCAGCTDELFDNSAKVQTEFRTRHMQETCVTVTWMRILAKYYEVTGEKWCIDCIEQSALNGLYGSMNTENQKGYSWEDDKIIEPLPFDSYSPLVRLRRGICTGGHKILKDGTRYGCCACIASAGVALFPLNGAVKKDDELVINYLIDGSISDCGADIKIKGNYLTDNQVKIEVNNIGKFAKVLVRIPSYFNEVNDAYLEIVKTGVFEINTSKDVKTIFLNDKVAFMYGPIVLAQDNHINPFDPKAIDTKNLVIKQEKPMGKEMLRFDINGIKFANYFSVGKDWNKPSCVSVWNDIEK